MSNFQRNAPQAGLNCERVPLLQTAEARFHCETSANGVLAFRNRSESKFERNLYESSPRTRYRISLIGAVVFAAGTLAVISPNKADDFDVDQGNTTAHVPYQLPSNDDAPQAP